MAKKSDKIDERTRSPVLCHHLSNGLYLAIIGVKGPRLSTTELHTMLRKCKQIRGWAEQTTT